MELFEDADDVEEWLEPLGYEGFWRKTAAFDFDAELRQNFDEQIAAGIVDEATVLSVMKGIARLELIKRFKLGPCDRMPVLSFH